MEGKPGLSKPERETNSDDFCEVQMVNSEEWECAEKSWGQFATNSDYIMKAQELNHFA